MQIDLKRRRLLGGLASLLAAGPLLARSLLEPTPRQPAGPFYPAEEATSLQIKLHGPHPCSLCC